MKNQPVVKEVIYRKCNHRQLKKLKVNRLVLGICNYWPILGDSDVRWRWELNKRKKRCNIGRWSIGFGMQGFRTNPVMAHHPQRLWDKVIGKHLNWNFSNQLIHQTLDIRLTSSCQPLKNISRPLIQIRNDI